MLPRWPELKLSLLFMQPSVFRWLMTFFIVCLWFNCLCVTGINKNSTTHEPFIQTASGSVQPQEVSTTQNIMIRLWGLKHDPRDSNTERHCSWVAISFNSIDLDLQSLLFKCTTPQILTPFMNTAAHCQHIHTLLRIMCRVAPRSQWRGNNSYNSFRFSLL